MGHVIAISDLAYTYPGASRPAVSGMSFAVEPGEVFGFLGPSGAGKTTTQRIVIGLIKGWAGEVEVFGRPRGEWGSELYDRIGVSFELPVGYPRLTVVEDLRHFGNLHEAGGMDPLHVLDSVGLTGAADQVVSSLSKGMRIRLNLARAVLHGPELLFLDEPTAGLDPVNARQIREIIMQRRAAGQAVFLTTHDMATASAVCDRVAFVVDGQIVACDRPRALELAHGRRQIRVEHRADGELRSEVFPLGTLDSRLTEILGSDHVETVHTEEAGLDQVFVDVTGHTL